MIDPDMGTWKYEYNVLGELVKQWDAKTTHSGTPTVTMQYDLLGRLIQRDDCEEASTTTTTTYWNYDNAANGVGKLASEIYGSSFTRNHTYDAYGRPSSTHTTISGIVYSSFVTYDGVGRVDTQTYPTGYVSQNIYNEVGFLEKVRDANDSEKRAKGSSLVIYI